MQFKQIFVALVLLVATSVGGVAQETNAQSSEKVEFFEGSAFEALKSAQREGKLLLLEFYAQWNRKSKWMHTVVENAGELNERFVVVSVDTNGGEGAALAQQYSVTQYPFLVVFNAKGDAVDKIGESMDRTDFLAHIDDVLLSCNSGSVWQLQTILRAVSTDKLREEDYERARVLASEYLKMQSREALLSRSHFPLFTAERLTFYGSDCFVFLRDNYSDFYDADLAKETLDGVVYNSLFMVFNGSKNSELLENIKKDSLLLSITLGAKELCDLIDCRVAGDVSRYVDEVGKTAEKLPENYEYQIVMSLSYVADNHEKVDDKTLAKARKMVEELLSTNLSPAKISLTESLLDRF